MYTNHQGYVVTTVKNHPFSSKRGCILEHRLVMEMWLRKHNPSHPALIEIDGVKYLKSKWIPHHINGKRNDNRIKNLRLMTDFDHRSLHNANKNNPMFGKNFSKIHRERLGISHKKWWDDSDNKEAIEIRNKKISESNKGREFTEEHKNKLKKRIFTKEWKQKISDAKKGSIPWNKGKKFNKEVRKYETQ